MKVLFAAFVFIASSTIAIGETKPAVKPTTSVVEPKVKVEGETAPAPVAVEVSALPECHDVTIEETSWGWFLAAYPAILFILKTLANILGALALKGSASAKAGVRLIAQLTQWLGWFAGFLGTMGVNRADSIKKFPGKKAV